MDLLAVAVRADGTVTCRDARLGGAPQNRDSSALKLEDIVEGVTLRSLHLSGRLMGYTVDANLSADGSAGSGILQQKWYCAALAKDMLGGGMHTVLLVPVDSQLAR